MHECIHILNDIDNGQDVKKGTKTFLWFGDEMFCHIFELYKKKDCNFLVNEQSNEF
jgi:hypothetical protein